MRVLDGAAAAAIMDSGHVKFIAYLWGQSLSLLALFAPPCSSIELSSAWEYLRLKGGIIIGVLSNVDNGALT